MPKFNIRGQPAVLYNTYQMYMLCATNRLERDLAVAKEEGYTFAAKLVRGAYIVSEADRAAALGAPTPLFSSRVDTDREYNNALSTMVREIGVDGAAVAMVVASHNTESISHAVAEMEARGIARAHPNIAFGQIMGMCDHLGLGLAISGYQARKLVLFGDFDEVFPWLLRRLDENRDMLGAAQQSRALLVAEAFRRIRGWTGDVVA
jgi:proline dehydrogenase